MLGQNSINISMQTSERVVPKSSIHLNRQKKSLSKVYRTERVIKESPKQLAFQFLYNVILKKRKKKNIDDSLLIKKKLTASTHALEDFLNYSRYSELFAISKNKEEKKLCLRKDSMVISSKDIKADKRILNLDKDKIKELRMKLSNEVSTEVFLERMKDKCKAAIKMKNILMKESTARIKKEAIQQRIFKINRLSNITLRRKLQKNLVSRNIVHEIRHTISNRPKEPIINTLPNTNNTGKCDAYVNATIEEINLPKKLNGVNRAPFDNFSLRKVVKMNEPSLKIKLGIRGIAQRKY